MTTPPPGQYGPQQGHHGQWQPGGYGQGPGYGQYPPPPPPPPKKRTGLIVAVAVIAVLVLGGAGVGIYFLVSDDDNATPSATGQTTTSRAPKTTTEETRAPSGGDPAAGDCIKVIKASSTDAEIEPIDCADPDAVYKIGKKLDSSTGNCPEGDYVEYTESGGNSLKLCLMLNAKEGDCFKEGSEQDTRADCAAADFKVIKVIGGTAEESQCGQDAVAALTYVEPATTICVGKP